MEFFTRPLVSIILYELRNQTIELARGFARCSDNKKNSRARSHLTFRWEKNLEESTEDMLERIFKKEAGWRCNLSWRCHFTCSKVSDIELR